MQSDLLVVLALEQFHQWCHAMRLQHLPKPLDALRLQSLAWIATDLQLTRLQESDVGKYAGGVCTYEGLLLQIKARVSTRLTLLQWSERAQTASSHETNVWDSLDRTMSNSSAMHVGRR